MFKTWSDIKTDKYVKNPGHQGIVRMIHAKPRVKYTKFFCLTYTFINLMPINIDIMANIKVMIASAKSK